MSPPTPGRLLCRAAALLFSLAALTAHAQVHHMDYTLQNGQFSTGTTSSTFGQSWNAKTPNIDQSVNGQRIVMGSYETKMSSLNGMQGPYDWRTAFPESKNLELKMMDQPEMREPQMGDMNGQQSSLSHYTNYSEWQHPSGSPKFSDSWVLHTGQSSAQSGQSGPEMSLQDINRYDFRASRSSEPGLPVTHAGTGAGEDGSASAGNLINTPALFDFGGGKELAVAPTTSAVHSGGMVAPQMISPSGEVNTLDASHHDISSSSEPSSLPDSTAPVAGSAPGPMPSLAPKNQYGAPRDGVNTPVEEGPVQVWARVLPQ
jgi:hypothetical protein